MTNPSGRRAASNAVSRPVPQPPSNHHLIAPELNRRERVFPTRIAARRRYGMLWRPIRLLTPARLSGFGVLCGVKFPPHVARLSLRPVDSYCFIVNPFVAEELGSCSLFVWRSFTASVALAALAGCHDGTTAPVKPASIEIVDGSGQIGTVGQRLDRVAHVRGEGRGREGHFWRRRHDRGHRWKRNGGQRPAHIIWSVDECRDLDAGAKGRRQSADGHGLPDCRPSYSKRRRVLDRPRRSLQSLPRRSADAWRKSCRLRQWRASLTRSAIR